jgi:hypothetical protein
MDDVRIALGVAACLTTFAMGCATKPMGQVQDVGQGTYSIGIAHNFGGVSQEEKASSDAVEKAGDYCHAKGLKLSVIPGGSQNTIISSGGQSVTFRCVPDLGVHK